MRITVIGAGYVGLVSAACFAEIGHEVINVDNDVEKIALLRGGESPIFEAHLPLLLRRHSGGRLHFSTNILEAVEGSEVVFICVGTPPSHNGDADLSYVEGVARDIAPALDRYKVIVEKSTVPVGTCEAVRRTLLRNGADRANFSVASNPEFLREGTAVMDFLYPERILLGVADDLSRMLLTEIYGPILDGSYHGKTESLKGALDHATKLIISSVKSAELIKHASNAFLALKISYINAVAVMCEKVGADVRQVAEGMGSDSRIGPKFLAPGIGYGGSCFPKDVLAFRSVAHGVGFDFGLLTEVIKINESQKTRFIEKIRHTLWTLRGKRIAVLGLAFKGGTDDVRDSPAIDIVLRLTAEGARLTVYDPEAMPRAAALLPPDTVRFVNDAYEGCEGADSVVVLTEWPEFAHLDFSRIRGLLRLPLIFDGKNVLDPQSVQDAGLQYIGVGHGELESGTVQPAVRIKDKVIQFVVPPDADSAIEPQVLIAKA